MASFDTTSLLTALQNSGLQSTNQPLYQTIRGLILGLDSVSNDVLTVQSVLNPGGAGAVPPDVTNFMVDLQLTQIVFSWTAQTPGTSYEIRKGNSWNTALYVTTTVAASVPINPILAGTYTYLIKAINLSGVYSTNAASVTFTVFAPSSIVPTASVVTNNVLFFWDDPTTTFQVAFYTIFKNGVAIGTTTSTFFTYFELAAGTYTYVIEATDIAGNVGTPSSGLVLTLPDPTDFILHGSINDDFSGTKVECKLDLNGCIIAPIDITTSYQNHFINNSWASPQAQVSAGYPIFIEPADTTPPSTYTQTFDFGTIVDNAIVNLFYTTQAVAGTVNISFTIAVSTDNITYDTPQNGTSRFATAVRYAKVVVTFTPTNDKSLIYFCNFQATLNVHLENDGGNVTANAGDVGGTVVSFNKTFLQVTSITSIVKQTTNRIVVIDFTYSTLNPTTFKILVFDTSGTRQTETVGWAARGILSA